MTLTIGVDVGGTSISAVAVNETDEVVKRSQVPTETSGQGVVASTLRAIAALGITEKVRAVGVGVPGQVEPGTGTVRMAVNLGIDDNPFPLGAHLQAALGCPVVVENDVKVAALGVDDMMRRNGQASESLALLSIGTGIAAGLIVNGRVFRGAHGMAGEIGHVVMDTHGPRCRCGQNGCLESVAAGPALARAWPRANGTGVSEALFTAAAAGDGEAHQVIEEFTGHLAHAITWLAATFDVENIVLSGGVASAGTPFLEAVRAHLREMAATSILAAQRLDPGQVTLAPTDDPPGPRGASVLASQYVFLQQQATSKPSKPSNRGEV